MDGFPDRTVCVLGLGYVGLTLAVAMADVGLRVVGVEIRDEVVESLRRGVPHFHEPNLTEMLRRVVADGRLRIEKRIPADCAATVFIVTVGTPLGADGKVRLDMIGSVASEVAKHLKPHDLVIMRSTVRLGTTRNLVKPILEAAGVPVHIAFCPERTLEGKAIEELRYLPQIVGAEDLPTSLRAAQLFQLLTPTVVRVSDVETAEMIKLIDNSQRDVHFAFSNEVARLCDGLGVSAAEVIRAGKLGYPRTNLAMPGPVGGPCLEKDPYILAEGASLFGVTPEITLASRKLNERQPAESVGHLKSLTSQLPGFPSRPRIALLGLAFKGRPETDDLRGTMARPILAELRKAFPDAEFVGYDAVASAESVSSLGIAGQGDIVSALTGSSLGLVLNNHPAFGTQRFVEQLGQMRGPALIYDFWNNFSARDLDLAPHVGYLALGSHGHAVLPNVELSRAVSA